MSFSEVHEGIHMIRRGGVNCWLIADEGGLTLVDAGLPAFWRDIGVAIRRLGRRPEDLRALILTHAHFDHVGTAARLQKRLSLPVYAHPADATLAAHPYRYSRERPAVLYPFRYPRSIPLLASMVRDGAAWAPGVRGITPVAPYETLSCPGAPRVIPTPGHTDGHISLHLPERDAVITGDALVTLDPYTATRGPRIVAGAATADSEKALASLEGIAETGARFILPGHGEPWAGGAADAVAAARTHGPS
ncbi:MBL fold metallo-hydrolase [Rothia halotolerans]|uniref:MBL fold metallo-hydrolase n=1 Tax=Rothia halotolerans TaxID=405770 RepID=UPI00101B9646|nr:MBL fold metallo-hydrolase [Rothia halotolerans]